MHGNRLTASTVTECSTHQLMRLWNWSISAAARPLIWVSRSPRPPPYFVGGWGCSCSPRDTYVSDCSHKTSTHSKDRVKSIAVRSWSAYGGSCILVGLQLVQQLQSPSALSHSLHKHRQWVTATNALQYKVLHWGTTVHELVMFFYKNYARITHHACNENHVTDCDNVKMTEWKSDKTGRLEREAVWITKSRNRNQDDRCYRLTSYWHQKPEVRPDEDLSLRGKTSINTYIVLWL